MTEQRPHDGAEIPGQSGDPRMEQSPGHSLAEPQLTRPQHTPCPGPGGRYLGWHSLPAQNSWTGSGRVRASQ